MEVPEIITALGSAAKRIIPSDSRPGAAEAQVIGYFEKVLYQERMVDRLDLLRHGMQRMDSISRERFGKRFVDCADVEQDAVLTELNSLQELATRAFFALVVNLTIAGFLGPPQAGGNFNAVGWATVGLGALAIDDTQQRELTPDVPSGRRDKPAGA